MHQVRRSVIPGRILPGSLIDRELQPLSFSIDPDCTTPLCTIRVDTGLVVS